MDGKEKVKTRDYFWLIHLPRGLGKFTKTGKFRLHITALNVIAPHARYKVRPGGGGRGGAQSPCGRCNFGLTGTSFSSG